MKDAAVELMARYPDVPSLQAYRYAAGLSQDQAAGCYNDVTGNQTSLGGTTINAWETWARGRGQGSPPSISSLLILSAAYGRGPLGVAEENINPTELIAEAYERLTAEDQLALKQFATDKQAVTDNRPAAVPDEAHTGVRLSEERQGQIQGDCKVDLSFRDDGEGPVRVAVGGA